MKPVLLHGIKLDWESTAVDYGLFSQCSPAPSLSGRGRLRSHVFSTGPDVIGCCHTHSGRLHHYHLTFDHHSNGNQHYCPSNHLFQCMCAEWHHTVMCIFLCILICNDGDMSETRGKSPYSVLLVGNMRW